MANEATTPAPADIAAMSFETAVAELETIVRRLEAGQGELEGAISDYQRGSALKEHCLRKLEAAKLQLETIVQGADGSISSKPTSLTQ